MDREINGSGQVRKIFLGFLVSLFTITMTQNVSAMTADDVALVGSYWNAAHDNNNLVLAIDGLNNNKHYIREESAEIIAEFGGAVERESLAQAAENEPNEDTQRKFFQSLSDMDARLSGDPLAYVVTFLQGYLSQSAPDRLAYAFLNVMELARDRGVVAATPLLSSIKQIASEDLADKIDETIEVLTLYEQYGWPEYFHATFQSDNESLRRWAREEMVVHASTSVVCLTGINNGLFELRDQKRGNELSELLTLMRRHQVLRAENPNFSLEDLNSDNPSLPSGWAVTSSDPQTAVTMSETQPHSFSQCLVIQNKGGTTSLTSEPFSLRPFRHSAQKTIEFGLFFHYPYRSSHQVSELTDPDRPILRMIIQVSDGNTTLEKEAVIDSPVTDSWTQVLESIDVSALTAIQNVRLGVVMEGMGDAYIDDIFVRRSESDFINTAPIVTAVSASPSLIMITNPGGTLNRVRLQANAADPDGDNVVGRWISQTGGELGEGVGSVFSLGRGGGYGGCGQHNADIRCHCSCAGSKGCFRCHQPES